MCLVVYVNKDTRFE